MNGPLATLHDFVYAIEVFYYFIYRIFFFYLSTYPFDTTLLEVEFKVTFSLQMHQIIHSDLH